MRPIREICLDPLANKFADRIIARGALKMNWRLIKWNSARVVSHRAAPLGEQHPDSGYRQVIVRLESTQSLSIKGAAGPKKPSGRPTWMPAEAKMQRNTVKEKEAHQFADNGVPKRVVEYLVMQTRLVNGREEQWMVQGFAQESTPETIREDEEYWRKTLDTQIASGEGA
jgi:mitochondrial protein MBA1